MNSGRHQSARPSLSVILIKIDLVVNLVELKGFHLTSDDVDDF